jgi:Ca-activated chloride channel family protein
VLVEQGGANLVTIAQDVKIQVEMNPNQVGAYRLIGYENRVLSNEDFNDDRKDAGEIGAGHTVTALYELLTPAQAASEVNVDGLRYQKVVPREDASYEVATVKLRYKAPLGHQSRLIEVPVRAGSGVAPSEAFRFSSAVAAFGMLLRGSAYRGNASYALVDELARGALGVDRGGYRREFLGLVQGASRLN